MIRSSFLESIVQDAVLKLREIGFDYLPLSLNAMADSSILNGKTILPIYRQVRRASFWEKVIFFFYFTKAPFKSLSGWERGADKY
ncbi:hypothetical protein [Cyclobacterium salsum]|uniref:hypothetical protein n=1 Tax=Cyclobacterium salsum TaxID=2666329 RepID=UPI001390EA49|nr:hypothetical protein [Cyclobacterium salsum]